MNVDAGLMASAAAVLGLIAKEWRDWRKEKQAALERAEAKEAEATAYAHRVEEKLDERILREFERMESQIEKQRADIESQSEQIKRLRARVDELERHNRQLIVERDDLAEQLRAETSPDLED